MLTRWMPEGDDDLSWSWIKESLPDLSLTSDVFQVKSFSHHYHHQPQQNITTVTTVTTFTTVNTVTTVTTFTTVNTVNTVTTHTHRFLFSDLIQID